MSLLSDAMAAYDRNQAAHEAATAPDDSKPIGLVGGAPPLN